MPNFSLRQQKLDKPVLHLEDEFQVTKTRDNTVALTTKSIEVKSTNPEARFNLKKDKDRRLIINYDLKNNSGTTSLTNTGNLSFNTATASDSWSSDSVLGHNVYNLRKTATKYITIGSSSDANIKKLRKFMNRRFTVMMWIKFQNADAAEDIFSFKDANSGARHLSVIKTSGNMLKLSNNTDNLTASLSNSTRWNHIAITYNFRNNKRKIFINGKKVAASRSGSRFDLDGAVECYIGRANLASTVYANADIYGFQLYNVPLPNREIKRIYELISVRETKQFFTTDTDLKLYYKFNDSSGTIKNYGNYTNSDDSINSRSDADVTIQSGVTNITAPFGGSCKRFDGTDDYATAPAVLKKVFHNTSFTIACWVRFFSLETVAAFFDVSDTITNTNVEVARRRMSIGVRTGKIRFTFFDGSNLLDSSGFSPATDTWYHLTFILDTSSGKKIYINGELNNSNSATSTLILNSSGTGEINFGVYRFLNPDGFNQFDLSDFRVYGSALTDESVEALYKSYFKKTKLSQIQGVGPSEKRLFISKLGHVDPDGNMITKPILTASDDMIFHLDFSNADRYSGSLTAFDKSGRYITGTLNNFSSADVNDPDIGNIINFDGTNDYISFSSSGQIDLKTKLNQSEFTVAFWVNFDISSTGNKPVFFISNANSSSNYQGLIIGGKNTVLNNNGNYTLINFEFIGSTLESSKPLLNNNWYHCAFTYSPEGSNRRKIYIDGVLEASSASSIDINLSTFTGGYFEIGRNVFESPNTYFKGKLADFRIFNRELNGDEIGKIYLESSERVDYSPYKLSLLKTSPVHSSGLMFHCKAENTGNNSVTDYSSNNHHASTSANLFDTTTLITTNKSFKFDSSDKDYMIIDGYTTGKGFSGVCGSSPRSITFWTKITNLATERPIIGYGDRSFYITIDEYEKVRIYSGSDKYIVFSPALSTTDKQHIAVVIDPLNNVNTLIDSSKLFINGTRAHITERSTSEAFTSWDGDNSKYIEVNDGNNMKTVFHQTAFSISMWVRIKELDGYERGIFESRHLSGSSTNAYLLIVVNNSRLRFTFYGSPELYVKTTVDGSTNWVPTLNEWYHLVFTVEAGGLRKVYKDGDYNNSVSSANLLSMNGTTGYVRFGIWSGYPAGIPNIDYADFRIYNKVLSANEVKHIYELGKNNYRDDITGLVHQWPFDGDQGIRNIMSSKHYGIPNNLTITPQSFDINTEIDTSNENNIEIGRRGVFYTEFDGTNDFISFPVALKDVFHDTSFSISFWVYLNSVSSEQGIFAARDYNGATYDRWLYVYMYPNTIRFAFYGNNMVDATNFTPEINKWYNFVCVFEKNVGHKIYIDGSLNNITANTTSLIMNSVYNSGYVNIGNHENRELSNPFPNMKLTDFRIYSKAISASEVSQLYKAGKCSFDNNLISGLAHHWKLNETFKYKNDNTVRHRSFDGTDDYISLPLSVKDTFHNTSFSISFWVRLKASGFNLHKAIFTARNTSSSTNNQVLHIMFRTDGNIRFGFYYNDLDTTGFTYSTDIWYHFVCVYVHNTGKRIYLNGSLNNSNSQTTSLTSNSSAGTGYVTLGRFFHNDERYPNMDLSDFRIYSKALSADEISAIYSGGIYSFTNTYNGSAISNLVYHYKLDSSSNLNDSGSNSANGTNQGTTSVLDTDIRHRSFDGTDDYIELPLSVKDTLHNTSFSIAFWVRPRGTGNDSTIFATKNTSSNVSNQLVHVMFLNDKSLQFGFVSNNFTTTGFTYTTNVWYHFVCVYVHNTGKRIYINGSLNNSNSQTTAATLNSTAGTGHVSLGRFNPAQNDNRYGYMDLSDFRIYSKALSASEVSTIYSAGKYSFSNTYDGTTISNLEYQYKLDKDINDSGSNSSHGTNNGSTSIVDEDIHYKNEKSNVFHGITHTITENTYDYFDGYLDDIRIYNKAITEDQIKNIYNGGTGSYTNETSENLVLKINPKDKTSQYVSYNHRSFDGDDYVSLPPEVKASLNNTSFSISFWWRPQSVSDTWRGIFEARNTSSSNGNGLFLIRYYSNQLRADFNGNFNTTNFYPLSNTWYYIVYRFESGSNKKIYINGYENINSNDTQALDMSNDSSGHTVIGASTTYSEYGLMDLSDFRIYSKALSASEISTIYTAGLYNYSNTYSGTTISNLAYQYKFDSTSNVNDSGSNSAHGTNNGTTVETKSFVSSIVLNDTSGNGLSNNVSVSNINMAEGEKIIFNGVDSYASTENINNNPQKTIVIKNKPEMTHESVIAGSKSGGSSLADGDFQIKVKPVGYSNHTRNLIAQYTFFEGSGTIVYDTAAKTKAWATENRLNFFNSPSWNSTGGPFGEPCIVYDGTNDSTIDNTISSSKPLWRDEVRIHDSPTAFSVSVWFNSSTASGSESATGRYIVDIGILMLIWNLTGSDSDHTQSFVGRQGSSRTIANLYTGETPNLATNTWYHATATWEWSSNTNGVLKAYLNGELITTNTGQAALTQSSHKNLYVGKAIGSGWGYFNGRVSNLQFFNSTLTADEVKEIYDTAHLAYENYARNRMCMIPHFEDRLLAHYRCDEGTGTILHDSSKYKRHGTIRSSSWSTHEQFSDLNVLSFDGTDDFVEDIPNFENELNTEYSITCWVKPIYSSDYGAVFSTVQSTNNGFTLFAPWKSGNNNAAFLVRDDIAHDDNQDCEIYTQKTTLKSGEWFHLSVTVSTKHIALYVNGVSNNDMGTSYTDVSESVQNTWKTKGVVGGNSGKLVNPLAPGFKIGVEVYNNIYYNYYQGKLSDLRIYKGTLTGEEVRQIYRSDYFKYQANIKINSKIYNLECDKMLSINQYHNLALVYVSGAEAKLYLDNYQVARTTLPSSQSLNTSNSVTLGAQDLNGARSLWFEGSIKEFRIYNSGLTNKEIHELGYDNERCQLRIQGYESKTSGLANASLINLGNDSTTKINLNGFDTTQEAITTSMPDGVIGKNIVFNGSDEYLSINTDSRLSNETQKNFTIAGWIKPSSSDSGTNNPIIAKYGSTESSRYYKINYDASNKELDFTVTSSIKAAYFDGGNDYIAIPRWDNVKEPWSITFWYLLIDGSDKIVFSVRSRIGNYGWIVYVNQGGYHRIAVNSYSQWCLGSDYNTITSVNGRKDWYHIAITSVNGRQNLYVDGKLTKHSSTHPPFRTWTHTDTQHENFFIGQTYTGGGDFNGYLSDLRIYSQELNIEDISRIFKEGLGGYGGNVNMNLELRYKLNNPSNLAEDSSGNRRDGSVQGNTTVKMNSFTTQDHIITTKVNTDSWSHFALVADSDTRIMTVFINGIKVSQQEIGNINNDYPEEIYIGGDGTNFFTGSICDFRIYDVALGDEVIQTLLYEGYGSDFKKIDTVANTQTVEPSLPKGLKVHYTGASHGSKLIDISGNKNNALLVNSPTITSSGKYNAGVDFDNSSVGGNWTFVSSTDIWTTSTAHELNINDRIFFTVNGGGATGYSTTIEYYVISVPSSTTLTLSTVLNGTVVNGSSNSSGNWTAIKPQYGQITSGSVRDHLRNDFSISAWVKFNNLNESEGIFGVYSSGSTTGANTNLMLYKKYNSSDGQNEINFTFYGGIFSARIDPTTNWIHIAATYGATPINKNLIAHIPFDKSYSNTYPDNVTRRPHTLNNGPTFITNDTTFSNCYSFDGTNDYVSIHGGVMREINKATGEGNSSNNCEITVMMWMKANSSPSLSTYSKVFMLSSNIKFNWSHTNSSYLSAFEIGTFYGGSSYLRNVKYSGLSGKYTDWNHYCLTIKKVGSDLNIKIYLNGELDTNPTTSGSNSSGTVTYSNESMQSINNDGTIFYNTNNVYHSASIKDFRVYNKALTDDEISGIMLTKSIYLNGELLLSSSLNDSNSQMSYLNVSSADTAVLGTVNDGSGLIRMNGTIDDFRIYNRKITSEEVSLLYNNIKTKMPLIQNTNGEAEKLYGSAYYLSNVNRPSNPMPKIKRDNLLIHYTFEGSSGLTIFDKNFVDKPKELYLNRRILGVSSSDSKNIVSTKTFNSTKNTIGGNWTFASATDIWTTTTAHNLIKGDTIVFTTNGGGASGYSIDTTYYVINVPTTTKLQLSDEYNGSVVNGTTNSSGNWAAISQTEDFPYNYKKCAQFNGLGEYLETSFPTIGTNWTFTASSDTWTTSAAHGLKLGDKVILTTNGGGATGYNTSTVYYVISVPNTTTITLSDSLLGSVVNGSANSSGNWAARLQPIVLGDSLWTISCWINTSRLNKTQTIWSFSSDSATTNEYKLYLTNDGNKLSFMYNNSTSTEVDTGRTILPNKWYNVVVVRNISIFSESILVYIDGEQVSGSKLTVGNTTGDPSLKIGCNYSKSGDYFKGKIGDFRIYDSPLNHYQIKKLYQGEETNGPVIHYTFDNSNNEIVRDMGSEGQHLTSIGGVLDNTKQRVGLSCMYFNGTDAFCKTSYPGIISNTNNTGHPMTICFWFKKYKSDVNGTLLHFGQSNKEIKIQINSTSPYNIEAKVGSEIVESMFSTLDGTNLDSQDSSGEWNHLALVIIPGKNYNNTLKNVRIFINGVNKTKYTETDTLYETDVNSSGDIDEIFLLGRSQVGQYFNGWIDDFRIYDVALSQSELFELYYNIYNYKTI